MRNLIGAAFGFVFIGSGVFDIQWMRHLYATRGDRPDIESGAVVYLKYKSDVLYVTRTEYDVHMIQDAVFYIVIITIMLAVIWNNRSAFKW